MKWTDQESNSGLLDLESSGLAIIIYVKLSVSFVIWSYGPSERNGSVNIC